MKKITEPETMNAKPKDIFTKKLALKKEILAWYSAEDTSSDVDAFLAEWVDTLIEETLSGGSNWNDEIEFIVLNCNHKVEGIRVYKGKKKVSFMATMDVPKGNGKTNQLSYGTFLRIIEAIKVRKDAKAACLASKGRAPA